MYSNEKEGTLRLMTIGEIAMAKSVFKSCIDYAKVWIHKDSYLPFGLQDEYVAMTPNGEIYYRPPLYRDDFSDPVLSNLSDRHTFIHELSHVWQRKIGMCVICRGLVSWLVSYKYILDGRHITEYPMEQQAQIIADSFILYSRGYKVFIKLRREGNITLEGDVTEVVILKGYNTALKGFPW